MQFGAAPLLERLRIFHSRDAEETGAFLRAKDYRFDIARRQVPDLDARLNGIYMPGLYMGYVQYGGASVELCPSPARTDTWIHLPLHGHLKFSDGRDSIACTPNLAAIVTPAREKCRLISEADSTRIQLALTGGALTEHLTALLGEPPNVPLDLAPTIDLTAGYGRSLAAYVLTAVVDLEQSGSVLWSPIAMASFSQFVMTALLLSHPHNYSGRLRRLEKSPMPRDIRHAVDYIDAHLDEPVTLADIAEAAGVPGRTLFTHFREFEGVSPMRYLRDARLRQVRRRLLQADPDMTVTEIAMAAGFTHMGRFSCEYRRLFGESPSGTLRSRRQAPSRRQEPS